MPATDNTPTVLLVRNAASGDFGGAETYQVSIASVLRESGYSPIIVTRSRKLLNYAADHSIPTIRGWWWSRQDWNGYRIIIIPIYIIWQVILTAWYIRLIKCTKASALHIQSKDDFIAGTIAGKIMHKKVIWTDHMDLRYIFQNITKPLRNPVGKLVYWVAHLADHLILISKNEHRLVTAHFKTQNDLKDRIVIIHNGVIDQPDTHHAPRTTSDFSFCLASRIVTNKGIGEAIEAYIKFKEDTPLKGPTTLDIYGDGPDIQKFQLLAKKHDDILFHGHQADAIDKIAQSDVFILPSYQEGFSIALLEATMLGKVIIASDVDSNGEIIRNNKTGLLVPVKNIAALAAALQKVYTDKNLRQKLEKNARDNYLTSYDLNRIVTEQITPLY